jgi:hypothetical protein
MYNFVFHPKCCIFRIHYDTFAIIIHITYIRVQSFCN